MMLPSPVGSLTLVATDRALTAVLWENEDPRRVPVGPLVEDTGHPVLHETARQLNDYFAGTLRRFSLPLDPAGTPFQKTVWQALTTIPFGETRSYAGLARQIGLSRAIRAVGAANGRNPLSIVVPCHRVIGSGGRLTGFAGGLETKAWLLGLEARVAAKHPVPPLSASASVQPTPDPTLP
jgi:methylated-DNA-[protein]-cysteine S-methyltransferase